MVLKLLRWSLIFFGAMLVLYGLHRWVAVNWFENPHLDLINFSYKFNVGFTYLVLVNVAIFKKYLKDQLGFLFLAGSFLKFMLFIAFAKMFEFDLNRTLFLHFFLPYFCCLLIEIFFISRVLKEFNGNKINTLD